MRRIRRLAVALVVLMALHLDVFDILSGGRWRRRRGAVSACYLQGTDSGECTTKSLDIAWLEENMPYCQIPMRVLPNSLFPVCIPKFQVCVLRLSAPCHVDAHHSAPPFLPPPYLPLPHQRQTLPPSREFPTGRWYNHTVRGRRRHFRPLFRPHSLPAFSCHRFCVSFRPLRGLPSHLGPSAQVLKKDNWVRKNADAWIAHRIILENNKTLQVRVETPRDAPLAVLLLTPNRPRSLLSRPVPPSLPSGQNLGINEYGDVGKVHFRPLPPR